MNVEWFVIALRRPKKKGNKVRRGREVTECVGAAGCDKRTERKECNTGLATRKLVYLST